ncbi:HAMP domain-containing histidine kinase [Petralouisia muris]|uniref:HAMP domain-containing histidine kinase n=1 Tax=Petralouisia muris TaxID=3032872 RepID=A0AC61S189_9FIRM|nr:HAMP domain-containing histidine kinase [Petralouisia muris]
MRKKTLSLKMYSAWDTHWENDYVSMETAILFYPPFGRLHGHPYLPAKIKHQIVRLSETIRGREARMRRERDQTRELIAEIAHQMRTPLANMESYTELLVYQLSPTSAAQPGGSLEGVPTAQSGGSLERVPAAQPGGSLAIESCILALQASEEKLRFLTESFIKMARLQNHLIQIRKNLESLNATAVSAAGMVRKTAEEKKIDIKLEAEEEILAYHDPNWLGEAVYNLLDNSVKYSPEHTVIIIQIQKNEMYAQIKISDAGIGIQENEEAKIFQRFYRGANVGRQPGFGLGLYLVREIVLLHGGFVKAQRREKGLSISIFLPV